MGEIVKAKDDIKRHVEEILVKVFSKCIHQKYLELVFLKSIKECNMRYADLHRFSLKYFNFSTKKTRYKIKLPRNNTLILNCVDRSFPYCYLSQL